MTLQQAISNLKIHQQWRLGADIVMIEPKELTESLDIVLKSVENTYTEEDIIDAIGMARNEPDMNWKDIIQSLKQNKQ